MSWFPCCRWRGERAFSNRMASLIPHLRFSPKMPRQHLKKLLSAEVKTLDSSLQHDGAEATQTSSCTAVKYKFLTVLGISLAGGLAFTLLLPVFFYLTWLALGFTHYGNSILDINTFGMKSHHIFFHSRSSPWLKCSILPIQNRKCCWWKLVQYLSEYGANWFGQPL